jgi:hypothetical protein
MVYSFVDDGEYDMNKATFDRAYEIMDYYKAKYPEDAMRQLAIASAEMEERFTADLDVRMRLWKLHTDNLDDKA